MKKLKVRFISKICPYCNANLVFEHHECDCINTEPFFIKTEEIIEDELILKYTNIEGGNWIQPKEILKISNIIKKPKTESKEGIQSARWGNIHSFVTESGQRFDAHNHEITQA